MRTPVKLSELPKRELVKPKPILPNMVPTHTRIYASGKKVLVQGYFRKMRSH